MTTFGMALRPCSPLSKPRPARSSVGATGATARLSSASSSIPLSPRYPPTLDVHLIVDNYGTHKTALIRRWFAKRPRFQVHYTPTSASWLNLVERWFTLLSEKQLRRGAHRSTLDLESSIYHYLDITNDDPKPFVWTKTADQILANVARFCKRTLETGH